MTYVAWARFGVVFSRDDTLESYSDFDGLTTLA